MKFSVATIAASLAAISGVAAAPLDARDNGPVGPDPKQVYVKSLTSAGTGCPAGSVSQIISDDRQTFTMIFDQYLVESGPGIPSSQNRKNCQINVGLHYPGGWQWTFFEATYRGYCKVDRGLTGTQKSTYYFSGSSSQCSTQSNFNGPYDQDYKVSDKVIAETKVWSPCGQDGYLNINSQVRISGDTNKKGLMTTDSIDGTFKQILALEWRRC